VGGAPNGGAPNGGAPNGGAPNGGGGSSGSPNGTACADGAECESGACADGVCCDVACDGVCEACLSAATGEPDGQCAPVLAETDPAEECAAGDCASGTCDGSGACALESTATECRPALAECDVAEFCDGSSIDCGPDELVAANTPCSDYVCDGLVAECPTSCASDLDCAPDRFCADGTCILGKRIFISSTEQNGALGGLAGADALCQTLATNAGHQGQFRAFMSDSTVSAAMRLTQANIPYRLVSGAVVADDWQDLVDGTLDANILTTETGSIAFTVGVMTGTNEMGAYATMGFASNCLDWQSSDSEEVCVAGFANNPLWAAWGTGSCVGTRRINCVEQ
jgi:hypothetical protein